MAKMDLEQKQTLINNIRGIIRGRWIILVGAGLLAVIQRPIGVSAVNISMSGVAAFVGAALLCNLLYSWYLKKGVQRSDWGVKITAVLQVVVDQVIYTVVVYMAGGIESISFFFFIIPILSATVLFSVTGILALAIFNVLLYISMIALEYFEIIPHFARYEFDTGVYHNFPVTVSVVLIVAGGIMLGAAFATFISRLLRSRQAELRVERDKTKAVIDSFADGLILLNEDQEIESLNPQASKMLGLRQASVEGRKVEDLTSGRFSYLKKVLEATPDQAGHLPKIAIERKRKIVVRVVTAPIVGDRRKTLGWMKILHDVTREELIDRLKTEFVSITSHQLRTPLSAIKWAIAYVLGKDAGRLTSEQHEILQMAYDSNERMIVLVNDLLNVSRIEEGRFKYKFEKTSLAKLINQAIKELAPQIKARKTKIKWNKPKAEKELWLDASKMLLAVQNVIDNAIKYSPIGGEVTVKLRYDKIGAEFTVIDTGIGIPPAEQKRLYTKFFRGTNALKLQTEGSGLGLFIVKNIVDGHGGKVSLKSKEKQGTEVTITLPTKKRKPRNP